MNLSIFNLMTRRERTQTAAEVIADTLDLVNLAEDIGFGTAWFAEHHFTNYSVCASPLVVAANAASRTKKIKLGTGVIVLPLYNPLRVAEEVILLDILSGGRAVLGVGAGYQPYEFSRFDSDIKEKNQIFLDYWNIVHQAITTGAVAAEAGHYTVLPTEFSVRPIQENIPIFLASGNPEFLKVLIPQGATAFTTAGWKGSAGLRDNTKLLDQALLKAGQDPARTPIALQQYIFVTDSKEEAKYAAECSRYMHRFVAALNNPSLPIKDGMIEFGPVAGEPDLSVYQGNVIIGDAEHCASRLIADIRALKPADYSCFFSFGGMPRNLSMASLERFGKSVLPLVEKELGPLSQLSFETREIGAAA